MDGEPPVADVDVEPPLSPPLLAPALDEPAPSSAGASDEAQAMSTNGKPKMRHRIGIS
jgi:hypothetical protein